MSRTKIFTNKYVVAILAIIACVLWGSAFPVLKVTYSELGLDSSDTLSRVLLAGGRFLLASLMVFAVISFGFRESVKIKGEWVKPLLGLGLAQTGLQYFFFYNGVAYATGIKSAILNSIGNFLVVIFAHFVYTDDRLNPSKITGLITGLLGILIINWQPDPSGLSWDFTFVGEGFLIFAGLAGVVGTFQAKKLSSTINPLIVNAYQLLFGSLLLLAFGLPALWTQDLNPTPLFWGLFVYSAFLSAAAFSIWYILLKHNKAGEVTFYRFMIPIAGTILSAIFLPGEKITLSVVISLLLVAFGIAIVNSWNGRGK